MQRSSLILISGLLLMGAGCARVEPAQPTGDGVQRAYQVALPDGFVVTVLDATGIVAEASASNATRADQFGAARPHVEATPDDKRYVVEWIGAPCLKRPIVVLERTLGRTVVNLYRGPQSPGICTLEGIPQAIDLTFVEAPDGVTAGVIRDGTP